MNNLGNTNFQALNRTEALKAQLEEFIKLEKESADSKALLKKWVELNHEVTQSLISTCSKVIIVLATFV